MEFFTSKEQAMPFVERSSSTGPRRLCYHKTPTHDPNQYWGSVTFWYGSGSSDPYLWLTDPDEDPKGPKTHGSGSPSLIRTYIARLADPDPHSFRFIKILVTLLLEFWLKGSGSTFIFVERIHFENAESGSEQNECGSATLATGWQGSGSSPQNKRNR